MKTNWDVAWVTGASSGLGYELALRLAKNGTKVAASARSYDKLAELAAHKPDLIRTFPLDVTEKDAARRTVAGIEDEFGPIDLAIINAGVFAHTSPKEFDASVHRKLMDVNYMGTIYALEALLPRMYARKSGHIAIVGSVGGYVGMPRLSAYGPTKAALNNLAESLKIDLDAAGIALSIINPGFIDTPMTEGNEEPMPFLISVEKAADKIMTGLEKKKFEIAFPWIMVRMLRGAQRIPHWLLFWLVKLFYYNPK